jgi:hypothetical protein
MFYYTPLSNLFGNNECIIKMEIVSSLPRVHEVGD